MQCARHPKTETELACGRCETPICPRCAVWTDVGARCPACAPRRPLPQFEIGPAWLLRGALAALVSGAALGAAWWLIVPGRLGLLGILLALLLGYAIAESVSRATNRKAGTALQIVAAAGVAVAYVTRNLLAGEGPFPADDFYGYVVLIVAGVVAISRLRY